MFETQEPNSTGRLVHFSVASASQVADIFHAFRSDDYLYSLGPGTNLVFLDPWTASG
jgi:hypothetical protein